MSNEHDQNQNGTASDVNANRDVIGPKATRAHDVLQDVATIVISRAARIRSMWCHGMNTYEIATALGMKESEIYNALNRSDR